ncbi:hypothetical protein MJO29_009370 [Puccinia striiformis f. sp. tritici]|nr:hypothetical protein MJO29_009370 [Puccinia striiformis f. sp. tritici]
MALIVSLCRTFSVCAYSDETTSITACCVCPRFQEESLAKIKRLKEWTSAKTQSEPFIPRKSRSEKFMDLRQNTRRYINPMFQ